MPVNCTAADINMQSQINIQHFIVIEHFIMLKKWDVIIMFQ